MWPAVGAGDGNGTRAPSPEPTGTRSPDAFGPGVRVLRVDASTVGPESVAHAVVEAMGCVDDKPLLARGCRPARDVAIATCLTCDTDNRGHRARRHRILCSNP